MACPDLILFPLIITVIPVIFFPKDGRLMEVASTVDEQIESTAGDKATVEPTPTVNVLDCIPPIARADAQCITLLSIDSYRDYVEFEIGWVATSDKAKKAFDDFMSVDCQAACGKTVPLVDVVQYGICDHLVCQDCCRNGDEMYPGAVFCPHEECRLSRQPPLSTSTCPSSSGDVSSLISCILLKITVFFLKNDRLQELSWKKEKSGDGRIATVVGDVLDQAGLTEAAGYFFSAVDQPNRLDWQPLDVDNSPLRSLVPRQGELLNLVVIGPGVSPDKCL